MECTQVVVPVLPAGVRPAPGAVDAEPGREDRTSLSGWLGETPPAVETSNRGQPTRTRRLRGSCDFCTKRKRKCDGDPDLTQTRYGDNRCSFCITKNRSECHYSERLPTGPRVDGRQDASRAGRNSLDTAAFNRKRLPRGPGEDHDHDHTLPPGVVVARAAQVRDWMLRGGGGGGGGGGGHGTGSVGPAATLKRARLGPSAATGLVGLHENAYIGDFFRTLGFLPLTNESMIRKAIVTSVFRTMQQHDSGGFPGRPGGGGPMGGGWSDGTLAHTSSGGRYAEVEADAASCVLWCTVALGYLVCGRPKEAVVGYVRLANEALSLCCKDSCAETARALTAMALVQNFLGNEVLFDKYVKIAAAIVKTLPAEDVPADLTNTLLFFKACDMFVGNFRFGSGPVRETMEAMIGDQDTTRQTERPTILAQQDLCRWVLETDTRLGACFNQDMFDGGIFDVSGDCVSTPMSRADRDKAMPTVPSSNVVYDDSLMRGRFGGNDGSDTRIERLGPFEEEEDDGDIMAGEPPPPGKMSRMFAAETVRDYDMLERATRIPEVKGGAGELYIRSITAYIDVLEGNTSSSYDHLVRGAEVMIANPGICRLSAWGHLAHCTLACLVVTGDYENYTRLRLAYNTVAECPATQRAPPWDEWTGMRPMCGTVFCRSIYSFFMTANQDSSPATSPKASSKPGDKVPVSPCDDDVDSTLYQSSDDSWASGAFTKRPIATATATVAATRPEVIQRRSVTVDEALSRSPSAMYNSETSTSPRVYAESTGVPEGYNSENATNNNSGSYSETSSTPVRYPEIPSVPARYTEAPSIPGSYQDKNANQGTFSENPPSVTGRYSETPGTAGVYQEKASIPEGYPEKASSNPGGYSQTPSVPGGFPAKASVQPVGYQDTSSSAPGVYGETPGVPTVYPQTSNSVSGVYAQQVSIPGGRYSDGTTSIPGRFSETPNNAESYPDKTSAPVGGYVETPTVPGRYSEPNSMPGGYPVMPGIPGRYSETASSNPSSYSEKTSNPGSYSETPSMSGSYSEPPSNPGSYSETVAVAVGGDSSNPIFRFGRAAYGGADGIGIGVGSGHEAPVGLRAGGWGASLEKIGGATPFSANAGTVSDAASLSDGATSPGSSGLGSSFHSVEGGLGGEGGMAHCKGSSASFGASFSTQGVAGSDTEPAATTIAKHVARDSSSNALEMKPPLPFPPPSPSAAGGLEGGFGGLEYGVPDLGRAKEDHLLDAVDMLFRDEGFEGFGDGEGNDALPLF